VRDLEVLELELILADLEVVERRLDKVRSAAKASPRQYADELGRLDALLECLQTGKRASIWADAGAAEAEMAREMSLLTAKKRVYVANVDEEDLPGGGFLAEEVRKVAAGEQAPCVVLCAQLEADLSEWPRDEAAEYAADVGLDRSGLESLAQAGYKVLDLITFFTITGGREVRAWATLRGTKAPQAAGKVHSQMERGFIRAEVLTADQLLALGNWHSARERGILRVEGRDYEVQDGDVCLFRFTP
jgi:ribosome-binding ATPase YchF (GTP1/OBG family)